LLDIDCKNIIKNNILNIYMNDYIIPRHIIIKTINEMIEENNYIQNINNIKNMRISQLENIVDKRNLKIVKINGKNNCKIKKDYINILYEEIISLKVKPIPLKPTDYIIEKHLINYF
jgi:uncharacterized protein YfeS